MDDSPSFPSGKTKAWNSRGGLKSTRLIGWRMPSRPHVLLGNISKYFWASWKQLCWRGRESLLIPYRFHILRRVPSPPICRPISGNEPSAGNFTLALPIVQCFPSCQMIGIAPVVNFTPAVCEYPWVTFPTTASTGDFSMERCTYMHAGADRKGTGRGLPMNDEGLK